MPTDYRVSGPFEIPFEKRGGIKKVDRDAARECLGLIGDERGCYVFGLRGSKGSIIPFYVGKTSRTFNSECFTDHKLMKYNDVLFSETRGTPVLLIVFALGQRGAFNKTALAALEEYLIGLGLQVNKAIKNIRGTKQFEPPFQIEKIHTGGRGKAPKSVQAFRRAFALR